MTNSQQDDTGRDGMDLARLVNNYQICRQRGHKQDVSNHSQKYPKKTCLYCETVFWSETVIHEENVPALAPCSPNQDNLNLGEVE